VSAYALQLNPPDFHAIFEVYLENGWWLIDPTRLAPIEGIVRIGSGRDASDIAFLTSDKQCRVLSQVIEVSEAAQPTQCDNSIHRNRRLLVGGGCPNSAA
jgi:hypothetical protein